MDNSLHGISHLCIWRNIISQFFKNSEIKRGGWGVEGVGALMCLVLQALFKLFLYGYTINQKPCLQNPALFWKDFPVHSLPKNVIAATNNRAS